MQASRTRLVHSVKGTKKSLGHMRIYGDRRGERKQKIKSESETGLGLVGNLGQKENADSSVHTYNESSRPTFYSYL